MKYNQFTQKYKKLVRRPAVWERSQEQQSSPHCLGNTAPSQSAGIHFALKQVNGNMKIQNWKQKVQLQTIKNTKQKNNKNFICP